MNAMLVRCLIVPATLTSFLVASANAQDSERYQLEKSGDHYVRMDKSTGALSTCEERDGQMVCRMAADERTAFQDEIDRLQSSVKMLDERVAKLEGSLAAKLESTLPSEEDFDKTMSYMERFFRKFLGIVKELESEETPPQKT